MKVEYVTSSGDLADRGAAVIVEAMRSAIAARGRFLLALSGGGTPKPVYERLAQGPAGAGLPWDKTQIYFGDERMVPCDHDESNFRMACQALLDHVPVPPWNVHRIAGEMQRDTAAEWYERDLRQLAGDAPVPRFDLILLGLGSDGHTASLFPGTTTLDDTVRLAAPVWLPSDSQGVEHARDRVTLTFTVINAARQVLFLVSGDDKAEALGRVGAGDRSAPAARVKPANGSVLWLVVRP